MNNVKYSIIRGFIEATKDNMDGIESAMLDLKIGLEHGEAGRDILRRLDMIHQDARALGLQSFTRYSSKLLEFLKDHMSASQLTSSLMMDRLFKAMDELREMLKQAGQEYRSRLSGHDEAGVLSGIHTQSNVVPSELSDLTEKLSSHKVSVIPDQTTGQSAHETQAIQHPPFADTELLSETSPIETEVIDAPLEENRQQDRGDLETQLLTEAQQPALQTRIMSEEENPANATQVIEQPMMSFETAVINPQVMPNDDVAMLEQEITIPDEQTLEDNPYIAFVDESFRQLKVIAALLEDVPSTSNLLDTYADIIVALQCLQHSALAAGLVNFIKLGFALEDTVRRYQYRQQIPPSGLMMLLDNARQRLVHLTEDIQQYAREDMPIDDVLAEFTDFKQWDMQQLASIQSQEDTRQVAERWSIFHTQLMNGLAHLTEVFDDTVDVSDALLKEYVYLQVELLLSAAREMHESDMVALFEDWIGELKALGEKYGASALSGLVVEFTDRVHATDLLHEQSADNEPEEQAELYVTLQQAMAQQSSPELLQYQTLNDVFSEMLNEDEMLLDASDEVLEEDTERVGVETVADEEELAGLEDVEHVDEEDDSSGAEVISDPEEEIAVADETYLPAQDQLDEVIEPVVLTWSSSRQIYLNEGKITRVMDRLVELDQVRSGFGDLQKQAAQLKQLLEQELQLQPSEVKPFNRYFQAFDESCSALTRASHRLKESGLMLDMLPMSRVYKRIHRFLHDAGQLIVCPLYLEFDGEDTEFDKNMANGLFNLLVAVILFRLHSLDTLNAESTTVNIKTRLNKQCMEIRLTADLPKIEREWLNVQLDQLSGNHSVSQMDEKSYAAACLQLVLSHAASLSQEQFEFEQDAFIHQAMSIKPDIRLINENDDKSDFCVDIKIPIPKVLLQVLLVKVAGEVLSIPLADIQEISKIHATEISHAGETSVVFRQDQVCRVYNLSSMMGKQEHQTTMDKAKLNMVVVRNGSEYSGVIVDQVLTQEYVVINQLSDKLEHHSWFAGLGVVDSELQSLVVDVPELIRMGQQGQEAYQQIIEEIDKINGKDSKRQEQS